MSAFPESNGGRFFEFAAVLGVVPSLVGVTNNALEGQAQEGVLADLHLSGPHILRGRIARWIIPDATRFFTDQSPTIVPVDTDVLRRSAVKIREEDTRAFGQPGTYDPHFAQR